MTPAVFVAGFLLLALAAAILTVKRVSRQPHDRGQPDLGVVSARWISDLRRDEPWSGS